ncbi:phage tail assembly protein [Paenibacillus nicotianae]|uniref:Phage tail assembly protein n=1 Tax=Paenibacillus nicotianae TaxID=1526551 RepID=A0ABW4UY92_9BACL
MVLTTEHSFELPRGYVDMEGNLHRRGVMRLATASDEILPMRDPRVQQNPSYLTIILLARVITKLGELSMIDTHTIEGMFTADLAYLQNFYRSINEMDEPSVQVACPKCGHEYEMKMDFLSQSQV